jgi:hypothetical protein
MKTLLKTLSFTGLALMLGSSILVFRGALSGPAYHSVALVGTVLWFATVPFWMKRRLHESQ